MRKMTQYIHGIRGESDKHNPDLKNRWKNQLGYFECHSIVVRQLLRAHSNILRWQTYWKLK